MIAERDFGIPTEIEGKITVYNTVSQSHQKYLINFS